MENEIKEIVIKFNPESFKVVFSNWDFDDDNEYEKFVNKLKSDKEFLYETFFNNFVIEDALEKQDQNNWKFEIE